MEIFRGIKSYFAMAGINLNQKTCVHLLNLRNITVSIGFSVAGIMCAKFQFYEASTFDEYANSFYLMSTGGLTVFCFMVLMWKRTKLFEFIKSIEHLIDERM